MERSTMVNNAMVERNVLIVNVLMDGNLPTHCPLTADQSVEMEILMLVKSAMVVYTVPTAHVTKVMNQ